MQRLFLLAILFVVVLAASLGSFLFVSLFPYFHLVGLATAGVVIIGLGCVSALIVAFTINKIGIWRAERRSHELHARVIVVGEVVAYPTGDGSFVHLSAMHEAAKIPPIASQSMQLKEPEKEPQPSDDETVLELYDHGISLRNIVEATGRTYYQVQKITSQRAKKA